MHINKDVLLFEIFQSCSMHPTHLQGFPLASYMIGCSVYQSHSNLWI